MDTGQGRLEEAIVARTVGGGAIEYRTRRLRLAVRGKPYYVGTGAQGLHLGYRRVADQNGTWIVRRHFGGTQPYESERFGQADDYSDADGIEVLTYHQAMERLKGENAPIRKGNPYTGDMAVKDYLAYLSGDGKNARSSRGKLEHYFLKKFAQVPLQNITRGMLADWKEWVVKYTRGRSVKNGEPKPAPLIDPEEVLRRRRVTANRVINSVQATLNYAYRNRKVPSNEAWRDLRRFKGVDASRLQRLTEDQARRLITACAPDFRNLVEAALLTGCRYGELCAIRARDFDEQSGTLLIPRSKSGKPRRVPLTDEGRAFFANSTASLAPDDRVLSKNDGTLWGTSEQARRIIAACSVAKIDPVITFHGLRHTFASILAEKGVPLMFIASVLGHRDTRMVEKHCAHLAPSIVAQAIRDNLPTFGVQVAGNAGKLKR